MNIRKNKNKNKKKTCFIDISKNLLKHIEKHLYKMQTAQWDTLDVLMTEYILIKICLGMCGKTGH